MLYEEIGKGEVRSGGLSVQVLRAPLGPEISEFCLSSTASGNSQVLCHLLASLSLSAQARLWRGNVALALFVCSRETDRLTGM